VLEVERQSLPTSYLEHAHKASLHQSYTVAVFTHKRKGWEERMGEPPASGIIPTAKSLQYFANWFLPHIPPASGGDLRAKREGPGP
jgi:hypothetical protein